MSINVYHMFGATHRTSYRRDEGISEISVDLARLIDANGEIRALLWMPFTSPKQWEFGTSGLTDYALFKMTETKLSMKSPVWPGYTPTRTSPSLLRRVQMQMVSKGSAENFRKSDLYKYSVSGKTSNSQNLMVVSKRRPFGIAGHGHFKRE